MPQEHSENFFTDLLKFILVAAAIVLPIRLFIAQPFIVSGASMEPTFDDGEYLIVDELSYRFAEPQRGDVIIFRPPPNPSEFYIKRIIGLPHETVYIQDGRVSVKRTDGMVLQLDESYVMNEGNGNNATFELGENEYFVLGDNRPASSDSRSWGVLPREDIVGRAFLRLFPVTEAGVFPGSIEQPTP